jgi:PTH1 family peptidyl-tRNA hydrolase
MKLIVGLGNPGEKYDGTRHNIGFEVIDYLAKEYNAAPFREKFQGLITEIQYKDDKIFLLKPQTYMNLSGESVRDVVKFFKLNPKEDLIVAFDDMDLKQGQIKIKRQGGAGGHNGIKSIISHVGEEFIRVKLGIGKPETKEEVINYVLGRFGKSELELINPLIEKGAKASKSLATAKEIERVIEKFNRK